MVSHESTWIQYLNTCFLCRYKRNLSIFQVNVTHTCYISQCSHVISKVFRNTAVFTSFNCTKCPVCTWFQLKSAISTQIMQWFSMHCNLSWTTWGSVLPCQTSYGNHHSHISSQSSLYFHSSRSHLAYFIGTLVKPYIT